MKKVIKDLEFAQEIEEIEGFMPSTSTTSASNNTSSANQQPNGSGGSTDVDEDAGTDTD